jgi:hypothetical protein
MKIYSKVIFTVLFAFATSVGFAPPPAPGGGTNPACWPVCLPIDGGVVFLITAVALYGVVKIYDYQKKMKAKV